MTPGKAVLVIVGVLILAGVWALVRRYKRANLMFDTITQVAVTPEAELPPVVLLPDGFTCLRCYENPALPDRIWCTVCAPIVDGLPAEPIERGGLEGCISRHPAGKQRKTGGDQ